MSEGVRRAAIGLGALSAVGLVVALVTRDASTTVPCDPGFVRRGARCCVSADPSRGCSEPSPRPGAVAQPERSEASCPAPLVRRGGACDAPELRLRVAGGRLVLGPSDWEAQGVVEPRTVEVDDFELDAFEVTVGAAFCATCAVADPSRHAGADAARAASPLRLDEARAICAARRGRLPTDDEWVLAAGRGRRGGGVATGTSPTRYPWGDAGAVCRRAAWGLVTGPCARDAVGPDTVGAHGGGDGPAGFHDLAGNVAEWTLAPDGRAYARGGSYASALAAEIRTWSRLEPPAAAADPRVGARCAYDVAR